jgi:glycosyltransferase involved in cell wall biosynthesis
MSPSKRTWADQSAVLIPAYNEAQHIGGVVTGALSYVPRVLVIDDGSVDNTADLAETNGAHVIRLAKNMGKGVAVLTGLKFFTDIADIKAVILMDGDGQHLPAELPSFFEARAQGHEFVIGNRMKNWSAMPALRRATNRVMSRVLSAACKQHIPDSQCGYRLIDRHLFGVLAQARSCRFDFVSETLLLLARANVRIYSIPIATIYTDQRSSIHPVWDTVRFIKLLAREVFASPGPIREKPLQAGHSVV